MKKTLLAALLMTAFTVPAFANEGHKGEWVKAHFDRVDSNKDGAISKSEFDSFGDSMFDEADTNNDNALSMEEVKAHKKAEMDKMGMNKEWKKEKTAVTTTETKPGPNADSNTNQPPGQAGTRDTNAPDKPHVIEE